MGGEEAEEAEVVQLRAEAEQSEVSVRADYTQRRDESAAKAASTGMMYSEEAMRMLAARGAPPFAHRAIVFVAVGLSIQDGGRRISGGQVSHALAALELDTVVRVAKKWRRGQPKFWEFTPE